MTRIDLDAVEAPTDSESGDAQYNADVWELRSRITALTAELRAAREVVRMTRGHDCAVMWKEPCTHQKRAIAAYDRLDEEG
jgi:hypothetical protein